MGESQGTLGPFSAMFLISNAAIGAGILNFPEAFKFSGGPILAMVIQIILIMFVVLGLITLAILSMRLKSETMQDIMLLTCGKGWNLFSTTTISLYSFFCCVAYHVVIGDQFDRVLYNMSGPDFCHTWYMNRKFTICAASSVLMLPFLFPKKIDFLKYISHVGVVSIIYVIALVVVKYFTSDFLKGSVLWFPEDCLQVANTIPPFTFAYHAHIQSVPVFESLKNKSIKNLMVVCYGAMFFCLILYSLTGIFGYLTFGSLVKSNVLLNYPADDPFVVFAILIVALKICCVYPVVLFCGRDAVIDMYVDIFKLDRKENNLLRRVVVATTWFVLAVLLALLFPNIGIVIDVLGFFVAFFMYIFPGVALLKHIKTRDEVGSKVKIAAIFMIILGLVIAIISITIAVIRFLNSEEEHQSLCK